MWKRQRINDRDIRVEIGEVNTKVCNCVFVREGQQTTDTEMLPYEKKRAEEEGVSMQFLSFPQPQKNKNNAHYSVLQS